MHLKVVMINMSLPTYQTVLILHTSDPSAKAETNTFPLGGSSPVVTNVQDVGYGFPLTPPATPPDLRIGDGLGCPDCSKTFKSASRLAEHVKRHRDERPHVCPICRKGFKTRSNLNQHSQLVHLKKSFVCEDCGRSFSMSGYRYHRLTAHRDEDQLKKYECEFCRKTFVQNKLLRKHIESVHDEGTSRKFPCEYCEAVFKRKDHKDRHITDVHSLIKDKLFECSIAGCSKRFQSAGRLQQHQKLHADDRLHPCEVCGKKLKREKNLVIHMLTAHPEAQSSTSSSSGSRLTSPMKCLACDFTYVYPSKLEAHLARNPGHDILKASGKHDISSLNSQELQVVDEFVTALLTSDFLT